MHRLQRHTTLTSFIMGYEAVSCTVLLSVITLSVVICLPRIQAYTEHNGSFKVAKDDFAFASYFASHMVLQQSPASAGIWGYAPLSHVGQNVTVKVTAGAVVLDSQLVVVRKGPFTERAVWSVKLNPRPNTDEVVISARLDGFPTLMLKDILFGDVWICSGQSNMQFTVGQMFGSSRQVKSATKYDKVRLFNNQRVLSLTPLYDLKEIIYNWRKPTTSGWDGFSAVCWVYGKLMHLELGYPVGLIDTTWGGTPVEAWSSPEALAACGLHGQQTWDTYVPPPREYWSEHEANMGEMYHRLAFPHGDNPTPPRTNSVLWNAMIHPFLNMTIKGAIWYQGEANAGYHVDLYKCTFESMVSDWRSHFHRGTEGRNEKLFPFGFVQIGPNKPGNVTRGYPDVRWHQSGDSVSGPTIPNSFMAVSIDLTDPDSPYGRVHYRDKLTAAERLASAGLIKVFKRGQDTSLYPTKEVLNTKDKTLSIQFQHGQYDINVRNVLGYEVCCAATPALCPLGGLEGWLSAPIVSNNNTWITLSWKSCGEKAPLGYRYEWRESPCPYLRCAVYSDWNQHPLPPMVQMFKPDQLTAGNE